MSSGKYAFSCPVSLISRSSSDWSSSQIRYPYGRMTIVPLTGPRSTSSALMTSSLYQAAKSSLCAVTPCSLRVTRPRVAQREEDQNQIPDQPERTVAPTSPGPLPVSAAPGPTGSRCPCERRPARAEKGHRPRTTLNGETIGLAVKIRELSRSLHRGALVAPGRDAVGADEPAGQVTLVGEPGQGG